MKKMLSFILVVFIMYAMVQYAAAYEGTCSAEAAILYQPDAGEVLYEKNSRDAYLVASTTKVLTALVVLENASCDEIVEIVPEYTGIEGSSMYLKSGERFTVEELLYGMLLVSGNDAAVALAYHTAGGIDGFAELMNSKAKELGCVNSHFVNPHGLDAENHYSCAYDLALIMSKAMEDDTFAKITGTKSIGFAGRTFTNHNKLLWNCEGVTGGKTGYTMAAGRILVSCCERDGMELVCVTISDKDDWNDHSSIYDWAYSEYKLYSVSKSFDVPVISGVSETVNAVCGDFAILSKKSDSVQIYYNLPKWIYAPAERGDVVGKVIVTVNGEITEADVYLSADVVLDESVPLTFWEQLKWSWYYYNEHSGVIPFIPRY